MTSPQNDGKAPDKSGLAKHVQTKQAPTEVTEAVIGVGYKADHGANEDVLGRKAGHIVKPEDRKPIVTDWSGMDDWVNCPPSYEVFFEQYMSYTRTMVRKFGVYRTDILEDISQAILIRYMERDSLGVFTPYWGSQSESGKSNFRSYYTRFIKTYVASQWRNEARAAHKHLCIYDAPVGSDDDATTWGDVKAPVVELDTDAVEFKELISSLRSKVKDDTLVDAMLELTMSTDRQLRPSDLRKALDINSRAANAALAKVRAALAPMLSVES